MLKRIILVLILVLFLAPLAAAQVPELGIGAFGGGNIPIGQEDQGNGSAFGFMVRIKALPFAVLEPNVVIGKWGAPEPIRGIDLGIEGSKVTSYGVDATIGGFPGTVGFKPYGIIGAGIYSVKNDDTDYDESKLGWSFGLGFGFGVSPKFDIDVRGKVIVAPQEEGSKKAAIITGGITYNFGPVL